MYTLQCQKKHAHDEPIWCCAWVKSESNLLLPENKNEQDMVDIVTGSSDNLINLWNIDDSKIVLQNKLNAAALGVISLAVSPDGKTLASRSMDSTLRVCELKSGDLQWEASSQPIDLWTVEFTADGQHILSGSNRGTIEKYNAKTGRLENVFSTQDGNDATCCVAYSPDGKYVAVSTSYGVIHIYDVQDGRLLRILPGHAMIVRKICFSADSKLLLSASDDKDVRLYDVLQANMICSVSGHHASVLSVTFNPDGERFASAGSDCTVRVWDMRTRLCQYTSTLHTDQSRAAGDPPCVRADLFAARRKLCCGRPGRVSYMARGQGVHRCCIPHGCICSSPRHHSHAVRTLPIIAANTRRLQHRRDIY